MVPLKLAVTPVRPCLLVRGRPSASLIAHVAFCCPLRHRAWLESCATTFVSIRHARRSRRPLTALAEIGSRFLTCRNALLAPGIIASKRCNNAEIYGNTVHDGGAQAVGIFLHRSSDNAKVYGEWHGKIGCFGGQSTRKVVNKRFSKENYVTKSGMGQRFIHVDIPCTAQFPARIAVAY